MPRPVPEVSAEPPYKTILNPVLNLLPIHICIFLKAAKLTKFSNS